MAHSRISMTAMRSALTRGSAQQCQRCFSNSALQTKLARSGAAAMSNSVRSRLPIMQKRTKYNTVEQAKSRHKTGPFSWKSGLLFVATCGLLVWYFEHEKERMQRKRIAEANKGVGRPLVGGPFELIDHDGKPFTSEMMKGKYALVYFGFTRCPDICPEELDKMARMLDIVKEKAPAGSLLPIFITCDPERDDPAALKGYLAEFHPDFIGLTGTYDQIKDTCKKYRVYFSTPQNVKPGQDYLVDHSIYFYLMDPDGDFVEALGRQHSPDEGAKLILDHMKDWAKSQTLNNGPEKNAPFHRIVAAPDRDTRLAVAPGWWSWKPLYLYRALSSYGPCLTNLQLTTHAHLSAADDIKETWKSDQKPQGRLIKIMVHGQVLGARLAPCCRSLARAGALRSRAATPVASILPKAAQHRAFGSTPRRFRERVSSREDDSTTAVNGAEPETNPAFADIAFAFDIDGVLYKGQEGIPGAREMLQKIRRQGLRYVFLTNGGGAHENAKVASLAKRLGLENPEVVLKDRVIQSHTPMRSWDQDIKENGTVLVTASQPERARQLAREYGFKRVVTPADLLAANGHIYPFAHLRDSLHKEFSALPDSKSAAAITDPYNRDIPSDALRIDQILVWNDPRDWSLDIQVIHDLLISHRGYLGTISTLNGDRSLADHGWQQDGQPALWISNLDLVWKTEHPVNRFGTGAFLHALEGVWAAVTEGAAPLRYHALGKPSRHTYAYAHERLLHYDADVPEAQRAGRQQKRRPLRRVYMVGDNPESDIRGANEFAPEDGTKWESILVRTGVFQPTRAEPEPRYKPTVIVDDVVDAVVWALRNEGADVSREWLLSK